MTAPSLYGPVLRMAQAATVEQAQDAARDFLAAGGSPEDTAALLAEWQELHDRQVQRIESTAVTA